MHSFSRDFDNLLGISKFLLHYHWALWLHGDGCHGARGLPYIKDYLGQVRAAKVNGKADGVPGCCYQQLEKRHTWLQQHRPQSLPSPCSRYFRSSRPRAYDRHCWEVTVHPEEALSRKPPTFAKGYLPSWVQIVFREYGNVWWTWLFWGISYYF